MRGIGQTSSPSRAPPSSAVCLQVHFSCTTVLRTVALLSTVMQVLPTPDIGTQARGKWVSTGHALGVKVSWTLRRMFAMHPDHRSSAGSDHVLWNLFAWLFPVLESALLVKRVGAAIVLASSELNSDSESLQFRTFSGRAEQRILSFRNWGKRGCALSSFKLHSI